MKQVSLGVKLFVSFLVIGALPFLAIAISSITQSTDALKQQAFNQLDAVRELKADQVESYFQTIRDQVLTLSENRQTIQAMKEFKAAFHNFDVDQVSSAEQEHRASTLKNYYRRDFLPRLNRNQASQNSINNYLPQDPQSRALQSLYISKNPNPIGEKHRLVDAGDGSPYSKTHSNYHPIFRSYLEKFGFYDLFLVDPETGHIVYSVYKEVDYATSLLSGPYNASNFAEVFKDAKSARDKDFVKLMDFKAYAPSYNASASFIASPIYDGEKMLGILIFQMPLDKINAVMTSNQLWRQIGLGESGETYLIGGDYMLRSQSRFFIEDPAGYLELMRTVGMSAVEVQKIKNL
ncbi:MAG: adenylate/guanylate cyclase domain-containing protein, partial [SAR324 cluster bacterium]